MTFMHMDATQAAAAVGSLVGFSWEDSAPYSGIYLDDGGDGFWAESVFEMFGEGHGQAGEYTGKEHNFLVLDEEWITPSATGTIPQYFHRTIDLTLNSDGTVPGIGIAYSGVWTDKRTDWRSFAIASPHANMTSDVSAGWHADASGFEGSSFSEEQVFCVVEVGKLNGLVETFEFTNVDIGADEIVLVDHGFETGDQVVYQNTAGSPPTPLVDQAMYSVRKISDDRISLGIGLTAIDGTPSFINLTFTGTGTGHAFQRIDAVASVFLSLTTQI